MWGFTLYSDDGHIWDLPITEVPISEKGYQNMEENSKFSKKYRREHKKNFLDFMKQFRSKFFGNCFKH